MSYYAGMGFINGIAALAIGFVVYIKNPKN